MKQIILFLFNLIQFSLSYEVLSLHSDNGINWRLINENKTINVAGTVPGGVYSDLQRADVIDDILFRFNDFQTRWIAYDSWTYSAQFNVSAELLQKKIANIVFHGLDTVAFIEVNNSPIGSADNMFVRYVFDVKDHLKEGLNEVKVSFASPVKVAHSRSQKHFTKPPCVYMDHHGECHINQLRKMQASFGWDWGPAFPSVGIWRSASLEFYDSAVIRDIMIQSHKNKDKWDLVIKVYLESTLPKLRGHLQANLSVDGPQNITTGSDVALDMREGNGVAVINMSVSENMVTEWWPNGYGPQPLYQLKVSFNPQEKPNDVMSKEIFIGFRIIEIVEENISSKSGNSTDEKGLTFYFKVNGKAIFMKGSNFIPASILPELGANISTIDHLLHSAKAAHMNMIRVWGGGVYESDYFYETCDRLGILVWQDLMFACSMYPVDTEMIQSITTEVEQNIVRLQHHPAIAIWAGNNENEEALVSNWFQTSNELDKYKREYLKLYVDTIKPVVESLDPSRRYITSSPSNGKQTESEGYISQNPGDIHYGDNHVYQPATDMWNFDVYDDSRFVSEYGVQSLPSISTMKTATNVTMDFKLDSNYSISRQHSTLAYFNMMRQIESRLGPTNDAADFQKFVYYSQISQAMAIKTQTEFYRQGRATWNTMGALYWQLNDVWQAPTWSGIEYGGKWKMLHYYAQSFFYPVLISPRLHTSGVVDVFLINDKLVEIDNYEVIIDFFTWDSLTVNRTQIYQGSIDPLTTEKLNIDLDLFEYRSQIHNIFLRFSIKAEAIKYSPYNYVFPVNLKDIKGLKKPKIEVSIGDEVEKLDTGEYVIDIEVKVDSVVLFLWFDINGLDGRFDDNGFIVTVPKLKVKFISKSAVTAEMFKYSLTWQYYMK